MVYLANYSSRIQAELTGTILPFWMADLPNREHCGSNTAPSFSRWNELVGVK